VYRIGASGSRFRPFSERADVGARSYSRSLQRAICDFGADHSFHQVNHKLQEHYGITIPSSAPRQITEYHANHMVEANDLYPPKHAKTDIEPKIVEEGKAPVRACYRYISNRPNQLDYQGAQSQDLPIGSGEVESAHRYVIQKRLKIAGAWWCMRNAKSMIALRVIRANNLWNQYWKKVA
jgi:hypothetical protein